MKETVIGGVRQGFKVKALADTMRPVNVHPGDGENAVAAMRAVGAEIVGNQATAAGV